MPQSFIWILPCMVHFRMVTRAVGPHQGVKRLATAFKGRPTPPFFMISLPSPTPNSNCLNQLSSSHGMKKKHITENMQPFISFCYKDGKNRLHNYGRPNSIFFVACLLIIQYMIVCYSPISHLITTGLIEGLELTPLTRFEWTLDIWEVPPLLLGRSYRAWHCTESKRSLWRFPLLSDEITLWHLC